MRYLLLAFVALSASIPSLAGEPAAFTPDPHSVQRFGPAYRYPQAGWIALHVEGKPYERGFQHGRLLAPELAGYVKSFAEQQSSKAPGDGWRLTRTLVNAIFLRKFDPEYLEEMKGIADGAAEAGAKFDGRPIDLVDVVAVNCWAEIETLDSALEATPNGLEGIKFPKPQPRKLPDTPMDHCSAFAATGPATKDGKIVFGHITMFGLYSANFFNVWLDIKPEKGHRVLMQSYPGGIQSGMDYYQNDAGILVAETTIKQTRFNDKGATLASRIRKALQYSDSIDKVAEWLTKDNNGLYTNEWLIGDTKTNEIAMLELGTHKHRLSRSSKGEWFGGTEGFYWGCNNTKDLQVRLDSYSGVAGRPENVVWHPSERDRAWLKLYREHKGKIGVEFAKLAFTTAPLASYHSLDAKFTTTDMAKNLQSLGLFGPPLGRTWLPSEHEKRSFPDIRPLVSNPWTLLSANAPTGNETSKAIDLPEKIGEFSKKYGVADPGPTVPAWHGTILPKTDGDIWLATSFAEFERLVAMERAFLKEPKSTLSIDQRRRLALERNRYRTMYEATIGHRGKHIALSEIKTTPESDDWSRQATGKGVLVLQELRLLLTGDVFDLAMDKFGEQHAGQQVTTAQFQEHMEKASGKKLSEFFDYWVRGKEWPAFFVITSIEKPKKPGAQYVVTAELTKTWLKGGPISVTVETDKDEVTKELILADRKTKIEIQVSAVPSRLVVDKYLERARRGSSPFSVRSFWHDLQRTLIVYWADEEAAANRDAAEELQKMIRSRSANHTVPIVAHQDLKPEDRKDRHLIYIGWPHVLKNALNNEIGMPVLFGERSIQTSERVFAHSRSGVIVATINPFAERYSVVIVAGLSAEATRSAALRLADIGHDADLVVLPHGQGAWELLVPTTVQDLKK